MGVLDFLGLQKKQTYTTEDVSEIIFAIGVGYEAKEDLEQTACKMFEVFCNDEGNEEILRLLWFELLAARLMFFYLMTRTRYIAQIGNTQSVDQDFSKRSRQYFETIYNGSKVLYYPLFCHRFTSYMSAFDKSNKDSHIPLGNIFHIYLSRSVKNRPLSCKINPDINDSRAWMEGVTSLDDIFRATTESFTFCHAVAKQMLLLSSEMFSSKNCNIIPG